MNEKLFSGSSVLWVCFILAAMLLILLITVYFYRRHKKIAQIKQWLKKSTPEEREAYVNEALEGSGFQYNGRHDFFYAEKDPWQKKYGYHRLYDEAAALTGMIIDCEPIYFEYDGSRWMLELWKGQYGMSLGGEIGLYQAMREDGSFFKGVEEKDFIGMHMEIYVSGRRLLGRKEEHWWLTGFVLGKSASPKDMKMAVSLTFSNRQMCRSFVEGLRRAGYLAGEYQVYGENVRFWFYVPHTHQPMTRGPIMDKIRLWWFRMLCRLYQHYTRKYETSAEKLIFLQTKAPRLFELAIRIGKSRTLFEKGRKSGSKISKSS